MSERRPTSKSLNELLRAKAKGRRESVRNPIIEPTAVVRSARNDLSPALKLVTRKVSALTYPENNVREINPAQVARIVTSIEKFGCIVPVLIDQTGLVIEGVLRVEAARQLQIESVPCIVVDHLRKAEKTSFRVTANRLQERGVWDLDALASVFQELIVADFNIDVTGFTRAEIDTIVQDSETGELIVEPELRKSNVASIAKPGDLIELGPHLIACGDARDEQVLQSIMDIGPARLVLTDQPYNVRIAGNVTRGKHREFAMASGEMNEDSFAKFNRDWIGATATHLHDGGILTTFIDWGGLASVCDAAEASRLEQLNLIVWAKTNAGMGSLYRSQHELLPIFKKGRKPHVNNIKLGKEGRWRSNVWHYAGASSLGSDAREGLQDHPTVKPVAMLEDALLDLTNRQEIVLDPFLGSGSTLIAAQRSGRVCRGIEIDPLYVDLIARRFEALTKIKPIIRSPVKRSRRII